MGAPFGWVWRSEVRAGLGEVGKVGILQEERRKKQRRKKKGGTFVPPGWVPSFGPLFVVYIASVKEIASFSIKIPHFRPYFCLIFDYFCHFEP